METIKSKLDISELFSNGKRIHTSYLTFIVSPIKQHGQKGRVAFIAGKKLGNAVWRNAAKRRMRVLYRELLLDQYQYDVILLAKPRICVAPYQDVFESCNKKLQLSEMIFTDEK